MASKTICTSCLRALRLQTRRQLQRNPIPAQSQLLASTTKYSAISTSRQVSTSRSLSQQNPSKEPSPLRFEEIPQPDAITNFAAQVRKSETFKSTTEPYIAYGSTEDLFRECTKQCNYTIPSRLQQPPPEETPKNAAGEDIGVGEGWWYQSKETGGLGLDVTFNTWAQVMFLYMYMLTVRLRCFPPEHARIWHQNLLDHFFYAAEDRMVMWHGMSSRGTRNKYLKDLWQQWRGVLLSYDEGLIKGDAELATALWRNVFKASVEADIADLALVTAYVRSQLKMLDGLSDESVTSGDVQFGDPRRLKGLVEQESPRMKDEAIQERLKALEQAKTV